MNTLEEIERLLKTESDLAVIFGVSVEEYRRIGEEAVRELRMYDGGLRTDAGLRLLRALRIAPMPETLLRATAVAWFYDHLFDEMFAAKTKLAAMEAGGRLK